MLRSAVCLLLGLLCSCSQQSDPEAQMQKLDQLADQLEAVEAAFASELATQCIDPMSGISEKINLAADKEGVNQTLKADFVQLLKQCDDFYQQELSLLREQFAELPKTSQCQQQLKTFESKQEQFKARITEINDLSLSDESSKLAAGRLIASTSIEVVANVGGLQLHRTITCPMEALLPELANQ